VSLAESYVRAELVRGPLSAAFGRSGFKTEARLLKIQADNVVKLLDKAITEMPTVEAWESLAAILGGAANYREKLRTRGTYMKRIGDAEKIMMRTLRKAFESMYKSNQDLNKRQQIKATNDMMRAMIDVPKKRVKALLSTNTGN
jgi:hypothetical protein